MADLKVYDVFDVSPLRNHILEHGELRCYRKGYHFCSYGINALELGIVKSGAFAFLRPDHKGNNQIFSLAFTDEVVGAYVSSTSGRRSLFDVVALCRAEVSVMPVDAVIDFMDTSLRPGYRMDFTYAVAYGFLMRDISFRCDSVESRYFELLSRLPDVNIYMSNSAIASYLGISREAFARMRAKMRRNNTIL